MKSFEHSLFIMGVPSEEDFALIKEIMPSDDIKQEDLFTYKVRLCDNLVDRDIEMFSHKALVEAAELYKGVIGIEDHDPSVKNNHSRIYKTELVVDDSIKNKMGDSYESLIAYAYTLNNDKNKTLIEEIKSGLKKEVSIGFDNMTKVCSVCGKLIWECEHIKGHEYEIDSNKKMCIGIIDSVDDAYEWSFVSIPAQRCAGVIKNFNTNKEEMHMDIKELSLEIAPRLDSELAVKFMSAIDELTKPESETVKSLKMRVKQLEDAVAEKDATIKEMEDAEHNRILGDAIDNLFKELNPKNDTLRELAFKEIEDIVKIGEDGAVVGIEEAKEKLTSEVYAPLFNNDNEKTGEVDKADTIEDKADTTEKPTETNENEKYFNVRANTKKSVDFTRVSKFKASDKKFSNKTVGISTELN